MSRLAGTIFAVLWCLITGEVLAQNMNPEGYEDGTRPMWARRAPLKYQHLPTGPIIYHQFRSISESYNACSILGMTDGSTACTYYVNRVCHIYYSDSRHLPHELDHCRLRRIGLNYESKFHIGWE